MVFRSDEERKALDGGDEEMDPSAADDDKHLFDRIDGIVEQANCDVASLETLAFILCRPLVIPNRPEKVQTKETSIEMTSHKNGHDGDKKEDSDDDDDCNKLIMEAKEELQHNDTMKDE
jgi:hypothetical protein